MMPRDGSPTEGRYTKGALRNAVVAQVSRFYTVGSQSYVECFALPGPGRWKAPLVSLFGAGTEHRPVAAGGDGEDAAMAGSDKAAKAVLLFVDSYQWPICIGFLRGAGEAIGAARGDADPEQDADPAVKATDHATSYGGASQIIDDKGNVIVDTTKATDGNGNVRYQLRDGAVLRVSRKGGATERATLDGRIEAYLAKLELKILALETMVKSIPPSPPVVVTYDAVPMPVAADAHLGSAVLQLPDEGVGDA